MFLNFSKNTRAIFFMPSISLRISCWCEAYSQLSFLLLFHPLVNQIFRFERHMFSSRFVFSGKTFYCVTAYVNWVIISWRYIFIGLPSQWRRNEGSCIPRPRYSQHFFKLSREIEKSTGRWKNVRDWRQVEERDLEKVLHASQLLKAHFSFNELVLINRLSVRYFFFRKEFRAVIALVDK